MSIAIRVHVERHTRLEGPLARAWAWLEDIATSVSCFPQTESCTPLGDGHPQAWRVQMQPRAIGPVLLRTVYICRYRMDRDAGMLSWSPLDAPGHAVTARMSGHWRLSGATANASTPIDAFLRIEGLIELPIAGLAARMAAPLVQAEFDAMADTYLQRVRQALAAAG